MRESRDFALKVQSGFAKFLDVPSASFVTLLPPDLKEAKEQGDYVSGPLRLQSDGKWHMHLALTLHVHLNKKVSLAMSFRRDGDGLAVWTDVPGKVESLRVRPGEPTDLDKLLEHIYGLFKSDFADILDRMIDGVRPRLVGFTPNEAKKPYPTSGLGTASSTKKGHGRPAT